MENLLDNYQKFTKLQNIALTYYRTVIFVYIVCYDFPIFCFTNCSIYYI